MLLSCIPTICEGLLHLPPPVLAAQFLRLLVEPQLQKLCGLCAFVQYPISSSVQAVSRVGPSTSFGQDRSSGPIQAHADGGSSVN